MEVLFMGPLPANVLSALSGLSDAASSAFGSAVHLVSVIIGGFCLWAGVILARWLFGGCSFRSRGRRR